VLQPFAVKALGQLHELPGASLRADGALEASPEAVEMIRTYMGRGVKYETEVPRLRQQLQALQEERTEQEEHNRVVGEEFAALAQLPDEDLADAIRDFRMRYPALREKVRADRAERELAQARRSTAPDQRQTRQEQEQKFYSTFETVFGEEVAKAAGVLDKDEQNELLQELRGISDSFLVIADKDNEDEGWKRGDWLFNDRRMSDLISRRVATVKRYKAVQAADAKAKAANAAVLNPPKPKAPPLAANAPLSGAGATGEQKFKDKDEWRRSMYAAR
jgi:hypothetical protein